ncbi:kinase-like protein [Ceratobasidium sp. AG-I]|nr:kinase-like protein [Ceratobasidium sp. AG-I]
MDVRSRPSAASLLKRLKGSDLKSFTPIEPDLIETSRETRLCIVADGYFMDNSERFVDRVLMFPRERVREREMVRCKVAYSASDTRLQKTVHDGKSVFIKSTPKSRKAYHKPAGAVYLRYSSDMFELKHQNIVEIYGVSPNPNGGLMMRFYHRNLLECRGQLSYKERLRALCEVLQGLHALHTSEPPIVHQCLKASNIRITDSGTVKISLMNTEPYLAFNCEPSPTRSYSSNWPIVSRWWSPEVFEDRTNISTVENDVWAFGCVVLEVLTGSIPYPELEEDHSLVSFIRAGYPPDSGVPQVPRLKLWADVSRCWTTPRPTAASMLNIFCGYLAQEIMRDVPNLTGQVERAARPFVRGRSADIYSGVYATREGSSQTTWVIIKHVRPNNTAQRLESLQWLEKCHENRWYFEHENICTLLGVVYSPQLGPSIVLGYYIGGNLSQYLIANRETLDISQKVHIISGILAALVHVHKKILSAWGDLHPVEPMPSI